MNEAAACRARAWLESFVIGLGLCPFAEPVHRAGRLRIAVSDARSTAELARDLARELALLVESPPERIESSLLVHPGVLRDFGDYNDFLDVVDALLEEQALVGVVQVASFHPDYRFADAPAGDPANDSNRSPDPMLHLLREESVSRAVARHPDVASVPRRNVALLRRLGREALDERRAACGWGPEPRP